MKNIHYCRSSAQNDFIYLCGRKPQSKIFYTWERRQNLQKHLASQQSEGLSEPFCRVVYNMNGVWRLLITEVCKTWLTSMEEPLLIWFLHLFNLIWMSNLHLLLWPISGFTKIQFYQSSQHNSLRKCLLLILKKVKHYSEYLLIRVHFSSSCTFFKVYCEIST